MAATFAKVTPFHHTVARSSALASASSMKSARSTPALIASASSWMPTGTFLPARNAAIRTSALVRTRWPVTVVPSHGAPRTSGSSCLSNASTPCAATNSAKARRVDAVNSKARGRGAAKSQKKSAGTSPPTAAALDSRTPAKSPTIARSIASRPCAAQNASTCRRLCSVISLELAAGFDNAVSQSSPRPSADAPSFGGGAASGRVPSPTATARRLLIRALRGRCDNPERKAQNRNRGRCGEH